MSLLFVLEGVLSAVRHVQKAVLILLFYVNGSHGSTEGERERMILIKWTYFILEISLIKDALFPISMSWSRFRIKVGIA